MNSNDRANLIKRINTLEGLTDKERSALLGLLRENKTYGLVWEDKPEDVEERLRDELPILTEVPERAIISEDKDAPNHILIEGDNLEALATLAYTHEGKIDIIYIDPPYNSRQYSRFYHVLENITKWEKPELFGTACKPKTENMSEYCRSSATRTFEELISSLKCKYIVVSYLSLIHI